MDRARRISVKETKSSQKVCAVNQSAQNRHTAPRKRSREEEAESPSEKAKEEEEAESPSKKAKEEEAGKAEETRCPRAAEADRAPSHLHVSSTDSSSASSGSRKRREPEDPHSSDTFVCPRPRTRKKKRREEFEEAMEAGCPRAAADRAPSHLHVSSSDRSSASSGSRKRRREPENPHSSDTFVCPRPRTRKKMRREEFEEAMEAGSVHGLLSSVQGAIDEFVQAAEDLPTVAVELRDVGSSRQADEATSRNFASFVSDMSL
ncbi:hypothetical protein WMY93_008867 [Mugilogobius chulae]|uniref:Uncharacterized protein n=1 Tax=Mugilogobius chulae TaxID=88201 RepID=A0AAW0PK94_9GOBI